jgi:hypothetical protein
MGGCASLSWIEHILIVLVVVCMVVAFVKLVLPTILSALGASGGLVMGAINILIWGAVIIAIIVVFFMLIECVHLVQLFPLGAATLLG